MRIETGGATAAPVETAAYASKGPRPWRSAASRCGANSRAKVRASSAVVCITSFERRFASTAARRSVLELPEVLVGDRPADAEAARLGDGIAERDRKP